MHIWFRFLIIFVILYFSLLAVSAYELTQKDRALLIPLYSKIDIIYEKKREVIENLSFKVKNLYENTIPDSRAYMILWSLYEYLDGKMNNNEIYTMPEESELHEATWLAWPHHYQYGRVYTETLDPTWVAMTQALVTSENVNILVYNQKEKERVKELLENNSISLDKIYFYIHKFDDVWARDNMPIYVRDREGNLVIQWMGKWLEMMKICL